MRKKLSADGNERLWLLLSALLYLLTMIELRKHDFRGKISCSESVSIGQ